MGKLPEVAQLESQDTSQPPVWLQPLHQRALRTPHSHLGPRCVEGRGAGWLTSSAAEPGAAGRALARVQLMTNLRPPPARSPPRGASGLLDARARGVAGHTSNRRATGTRGQWWTWWTVQHRTWPPSTLLDSSVGPSLETGLLCPLPLPPPGPGVGSLGRGARGGWEGSLASLGPLTARLRVTHPDAGPEPSLLERGPQLRRCCVSRPGLSW